MVMTELLVGVFVLGAAVGYATAKLLLIAAKKPQAAPEADVIPPDQLKQQRLQQENEKLKADLKNYSTILNMVSYPIWQRDAKLGIHFYNLAYNEAIEDVVDRGEGGGAPELDKRVIAIAKTALESGKPVSERRHIVVGGERRLYHIVEMPVPQEKTMVGFAIDMTEVEQLKEDLARHVSAQDDLLESSASAMAIYGGDMRLKSFNYAFVSLWKLDEVWLDTQPTYAEILETLREKRKLPEQANFQLFKQQQIKLFTDLIEPREEFFYLPDGRSLRVIAIPHALGGILFAYEDVTDRLALERSYNTLIAVQRETLDHLHEGVAVFGEDGRLKLYNHDYLRLWHLDEEFARSEPHIQEVVEKSKHLFIYENWDAFKTDHVAHIQTRTIHSKQLERSDGKVIEWRKIPLPDGATLITHLDVTDSKLVERSLRERNEALQEADKLKTEFLANVSYELRSPLTSISGFSEMLRQEYFGSLSEKQKEYVDGIHQSSQHLMQLINDILDLASIEAGYMRLEVGKFDINAMMKSVLALVQERSKENHIKVKFECPAKIGKMTGDETRIKQMLFNLLSNAFKYSQPGQTITLSAREAGEGGVVLSVEDQGPGIPHEEQQAIFAKFYKGKNQEALRGKGGQRSGTGLGLSIVKSFVELHGGEIRLTSEPGRGSTFECVFLRHNPELQQFAAPKKMASA
jgi:signal transduction histidine kinase